jgi:catechol-2,3-dioxygenase
MVEKTVIQHVALQYISRKQAETFFTKILGLQLKKTFTVSKELSEAIFKIKEDVIVDVYSNDKAYFEIFIIKKQTNHGYNHIGIEINDKEEFLKQCKNYDLEPIFVEKDEKTLLFIKDYAGNLFEIK